MLLFSLEIKPLLEVSGRGSLASAHRKYMHGLPNRACMCIEESGGMADGQASVWLTAIASLDLSYVNNYVVGMKSL